MNSTYYLALFESAQNETLADRIRERLAEIETEINAKLARIQEIAQTTDGDTDND